MLFFVKVRIDLNKLKELGKKLEKGELDLGNILSTYCLKDDPSVGINIWEADNIEEFECAFEPHKKYYVDVIEVTPVITPEESQKLLLEQIS